MTEELSLTEKNIEDVIYEIRGKQVMLDSNLAKLYNIETKRINETVNRNKEKFSTNFSWKLTDEETEKLLVAICDQKNETRGGRFKNPRVFTEQGVAMLSTILKKENVNIITSKILEKFHTLKTNIILDETLKIKDLIYEIDGKQVMLDSDLAILYQVETKRINEAAKNNIDKFPKRFCFKISEQEYQNLKSKFSTSSLVNTYGGF